jgi:hypothetical protein
MVPFPAAYNASGGMNMVLGIIALVLAALVDYALLVASARGKNWQQEDREQMEYLRQYSKRKR